MHLEKKELVLNYKFYKKKGNLQIPVQILDGLIIGKGIEKIEEIVLAGFITNSNLRLLKISNSYESDPVYCTLMRDGSSFGGYFGPISLLPRIEHDLYSSIERTFDNIDGGNYLIDKTTFELIEKLRQNPFEFNRGGSCMVKLI